MGATREAIEALRERLGSVVLGQRRAAEEVLAALLAGGHVLLEGVPGVAKTLLAGTLADALGLQFRRVQFTPDLMPADVVGTTVFDLREGVFHVQKGPVFTDVLLADEINRTPPRTQAALLEAMQERQVTLDGTSHPLGDHFFVVATQNPFDHEGTYPLPEAQLDRFLMKVVVDYPPADAERALYRRFVDGRMGVSGNRSPLPPVLGRAELDALRAAARAVRVDDRMVDYVYRLVAATRSLAGVTAGASPRAGLALLAAARSWATLEDRDFMVPDDVKRVATPVLRHRLRLGAEAELEGRTGADFVRQVLERVEVPR